MKGNGIAAGDVLGYMQPVCGVAEASEQALVKQLEPVQADSCFGY